MEHLHTVLEGVAVALLVASVMGVFAVSVRSRRTAYALEELQRPDGKLSIIENRCARRSDLVGRLTRMEVKVVAHGEAIERAFNESAERYKVLDTNMKEMMARLETAIKEWRGELMAEVKNMNGRVRDLERRTVDSDR